MLAVTPYRIGNCSRFVGHGPSTRRASFGDQNSQLDSELDQSLRWVCGAMVARLTSIVIRYQKVAVSSTVTLILFA